MRNCVLHPTNGRRNVDDPFNQLGLLHIGHCLVTLLKLVASQFVTRFQRHDPSGPARCRFRHRSQRDLRSHDFSLSNEPKMEPNTFSYRMPSSASLPNVTSPNLRTIHNQRDSTSDHATDWAVAWNRNADRIVLQRYFAHGCKRRTRINESFALHPSVCAPRIRVRRVLSSTPQNLTRSRQLSDRKESSATCGTVRLADRRRSSGWVRRVDPNRSARPLARRLCRC